MAITTAQRDSLIELYIAMLDRAPDSAGLSFWASVLEQKGGDLNYVADQMWKSPGAKADYPAYLSTNETVARVYENVLNRAPDPAGLAFWVSEWNAKGASTTILAMINNLKTNSSTDPQFLLDKQLFLNKVDFGEWFAVTLGSNDTDLAKTGNEAITSDPASVVAAQELVQAVAGETKILTGATDIITLGAGDDTFVGTQATLNTSDKLTGGDGYDILSVNVETNNWFFTAPTLSGIEKISVTAGGSSYVYGSIDLSRATGYEVLELFQNEDLYFTWADIQNVNDTQLSIIDTYGEDSDVNYIYDTNAYEAGSGIDTARLTVAEVGSLANQAGPNINFMNETPNGSSSNVDVVDLQSLWNGQVNDTNANYIHDLNVGSNFRTLMIGGNVATDLGLPESTTNTDGNLEIEHFLEPSLRLIDARLLNANLTLDVDGNQGTNGDATEGVYANNGRTFSEAITIYGAQGNDFISIKDSTNALINLGTGNDTLNIGSNSDDSDNSTLEQNVQGHQTIDSGAGNDTVRANLTGIQNITLGTGNDALTLVGDVDSTLTSIYGDGVSTVSAGDGNDTVSLTHFVQGTYNEYTVDLGTGDDRLTITSNGNETVTAGDGADSVTINGNGNDNVNGGAGADTITINGNGNQTIVSGPDDATDGNDRVTVNGDGVHNVRLGDGNDYLLINGAWTTEENFDYGVDDITVINAGAGNDYVQVNENHFLNVDLATGNDTIMLRAKDLTADDAVNGNTGIDTMILTNIEGASGRVRVRDSETSSTQGLEIFDLRDSGIELHMTAEMFDTAEGKDITVITELSDNKVIPQLYLASNGNAVNALSQGMTREDWDAIVEDWEDGVYDTDGYDDNEAGLIDYLTNGQGLDSVDFTDASNGPDGAEPEDNEIISGYDAPSEGNDVWDDEDLVFFRFEEESDQIVNVTDIPLTLVNGRTFTLLGGTIRDIVIADEASLNGNMTLRFDNGGSDADSVEDTLIVQGEAYISAADLRNVTGLENIVLESGSNSSVDWDIELTDNVINQTTGSAPLEIVIDPEVAAGSTLTIHIDDSTRDALNNVIIRTVANVQVFIHDAVTGITTPVNEDDFGVTDYNPGNNTITVLGGLLFTTNFDSLIGGEDTDDVFYAASADQVQGGDSADGLGGEDELHLAFAPSNGDDSLQDALNDPFLQNIEVLRFVAPGGGSILNPGANVATYSVQLDGLSDFDFEDFLGDSIREVHTGNSSDDLEDMEDANVGEDSISYWTYDGDDYVDIDGNTGGNVFAGNGDDYIDGSDGEDYLDGADGDDTIYGNNGHDTIYGGAGEDYIDAGEGFNYVDGGTDNDTIYAGSGGDTIIGGTGDDYIAAGEGNNSVVAGEGNDQVYAGAGSDTVDGGNGNDYISIGNGENRVTAGEGNNTVSTGSGNDRITALSGADSIVSGGGNDSINSGAGNDYISAGSGSTSIDAGAGNDILVITELTIADTINGGDNTDTLFINPGANDSTLVDVDFTNVSNMEVLDMGDGNDSVTGAAQFEEAGFDSIYGGNGNDTLTFTTVSNAAPLYIDGGAGNDNIEGGIGADTILGGSGNDIIQGNGGGDLVNLTGGGSDTVVFERGDDGALTGAESGYDLITGFDIANDVVLIDGLLESAVLEGGWSEVTDNFSIDLTGSTEVAIYTNTGLLDTDLTDMDTMIVYLNNFLALSNAGDDTLFMVQGTDNTALYYYVENGGAGANIIDSSEIRILGVFEDALLTAAQIGN